MEVGAIDFGKVTKKPIKILPVHAAPLISFRLVLRFPLPGCCC